MKTLCRRRSERFSRLWPAVVVWGFGVPAVAQEASTATATPPPAATHVADIGSRLELMVDRFLVSELKGAELKLHTLQPAPPAAKSRMGGWHYATVLKDGDRFRQYGRGYHVGDSSSVNYRNVGWEATRLNEVTLYAESADGICWNQPELGLFDCLKIDQRLLDFAEKRKITPNRMSNIVVANEFGPCHNFTPFIDTRPGIPADQRYKALGGLTYFECPEKRQWPAKYGPDGLRAFVSADGIRWKRLRQEPVIPGDWGKFDSQNVAFWSEAEQQYVSYFRFFDGGRRAVKRSTSKDFLNWTEPVVMKGRRVVEKEELYTNGTRPYFRAPHIYIAPATWYLAKENPNTRVILMTTRAGSDTYDRTFGQEQFLADPKAGNRTNYLAWDNGVQTGPRELSFYNLGLRYTLRLDGFGSVRAGPEGGELITKPLNFRGKALVVNFETRADGSLRVEIQDAVGKPLRGFGLEDCAPLCGDEIEKPLVWKGGTDLGALAGKPVRLRIGLKDADLYALQFREKQVP